MMRLKTDSNVCSGCRSCEVVCSIKHEQMVHPPLARLRIEKEEEQGKDIPVVCLQCEEASCAAVCPVECIRRDERIGVWLVHEEECTGCGICADACQWHAIRVHPERRVAFKCDLCGGTPECVAVCQLQAVHLESFGKDDESQRRPV